MLKDTDTRRKDNWKLAFVPTEVLAQTRMGTRHGYCLRHKQRHGAKDTDRASARTVHEHNS